MNFEKYKCKSRILLVITPNFKDKSYQRVKKIYSQNYRANFVIKILCDIN